MHKRRKVLVTIYEFTQNSLRFYLFNTDRFISCVICFLYKGVFRFDTEGRLPIGVDVIVFYNDIRIPYGFNPLYHLFICDSLKNSNLIPDILDRMTVIKETAFKFSPLLIYFTIELRVFRSCLFFGNRLLIILIEANSGVLASKSPL